MPSQLFEILSFLLALTTGSLFYLYTKTKNSKPNGFTQDEFDQKLSVSLDKSRQEIIAQKNQQLEETKAELKQNFSERLASTREDLDHKNELIVEKLKLQAKNDLQEEERAMRKRLLELQENIDKKESNLELKLEKVANDKAGIEKYKEDLRAIKDDLLNKKHLFEDSQAQFEIEKEEQIGRIARLSPEEARKAVLDVAKEQMGGELLNWQQKYLESAREEAGMQAREVVALAVQRCSSEVANELTITTVKLQQDDDKGKLIGKAGRNIQWLEKTLGVELVIDETPGVVTLSGFSSVRRHIAKKTLERLLADGRVHPASIEDQYAKAKAEMAQEIADAGQETVNELGIYDFQPQLIRIIGRLKFRTSYGQNMIRHSLEMAKLARLIAVEMNARFPNRSKPIDVDVCVKGALLHDIGKAVDEETTPKGNHIDLGEQICDKFGLDWRIRKCVSSHHDESYYDSEHGFCIEAAIVDACDNISGGRIGARKETAEAYFQRMTDLERIAETTSGVTKSWIMRGSRELWVFFDTESVSPAQMHTITRKIADRIQTEVRYPGEIKIVGLWEDKIVEYAM